MSTTYLALLQEIGRQLGWASGVPTSGSATTCLDTSSDSPMSTGDSSSLFKNAWILITADSAGTPRNVGEARRITTYTPASQQLTHDAFAYAVATTMTYNVFFGTPPIRVGLEKPLTEYVNDVLRNLKYRTPVLLTLVTDGDMETSGVANWTDGTSAGTLEKSTTVGVTYGKQSLLVQPTADDGYAATPNINVTGGQTYVACVDVKTLGGVTPYGGTLEAYDATNSASIDTVSTSTATRSQRYLWLSFTTPATCVSLQIRLRTDTAGNINYWDNLSLRQQGNRELALPSWFVNPAWAERLYYLGGGSNVGSGDDYAADERTPHEMDWFGIVEDHTAATFYKLQYHGNPPVGSHLFLECLRPYGELSALTDTTDADKDLIKAYVLANVYADRKDGAEMSRWLAQAEDLHKRLSPVAKPPIQMPEWL